MAKNVDNAFKNAVWREGFSLEQQVFKILKENKWELLPNRYYFDKFLNRTREFDLLAYKYYSVKGINVFVALIVECKFNPCRIVFYSRRSDGVDYEIRAYIGDYVAEFFNRSQANSVFKRLKKFKSIFRNSEQIFGYQVFEEFEDKQNGKKAGIRNFRAKPDLSEKNVFTGINTAIQATRFEESIRDRSQNVGNVFFYFPVVVFSDHIYKADLENQNRTLIREKIIKYRAGMANGFDQVPDEFTVHICDLRNFNTLIRAFDHVSNKLTSELEKAAVNKNK